MYYLEAVKSVVSAFEIDTKSLPNRIGYHGTSLQTIEYVLEEGILPGGSIENPQRESAVAASLNKVHFYPIKEAMQLHRRTRYFLSEREAFQKASEYAGDIAKVHSVLSAFDIPLTDGAAQTRAMIMTGFAEPSTGQYQEAFAEFLAVNRSVSEKALRETLIFAMENAKGIVLGIDRAALDGSVVNMSKGEEVAELVMDIPHGLSHRYIASIDPQGNLEYEFLDDLQQRLEKGLIDQSPRRI